MSFKVGDKVKVRSDLSQGEKYGGIYFVGGMCKFRGKTVVIDRVVCGGDYYGIKGYPDSFWTDEMFEPVNDQRKYKIGDRVVIEKSNIEHSKKYAGKSGTIVEGPLGETYIWKVKTDDGERVWCDVKCYAEEQDMKKTTFKIGDKVIGNHPTRYNITKKGWKGVVTKVNPDGLMWVKGEGNPDHNTEFIALEPQYFDLVSTTNEKIVITHDGKTTTATMYRNDGTKKVAIARCAPEDTFDFAFGANLAMERLIGKTEPKPEPSKYYNGKVVCIKNKGNGFTVGKIYEIVNGKFTDDGGSIRPITDDRVVTADDLTKNSGYFKNWPNKFIPLVEDKNEPLTIEELKKMDGKKVWCVRLDGNCTECPDHSYSGWHTVDVRQKKLTDDHGMFYDFSSMDDGYGFHAYLKPPTK